MIELTQEQKKNIGKYIKPFIEFLRTDKGNEWGDERKEREKFFDKYLSKRNIDSLTEESFKEIIKVLWASQLWGNKEYLANKILQENGFPKIKDALKNLLYGNAPLNERYTNFRKRIKGLGTSSITEILVFVSPSKYCLWNEKPKNVLPFLGMEKLLPAKVYRYQINDGKDYVKCNEVLGLIKDEISNYIKNPGFVDLDFFLAFIFYEILPEERKEEVKVEKRVSEVKEELKQISTHPEAEGILLELGNLLGFDTYVTIDDASKKYKGKKLGELAQLKEIPPFTYQRLINTAKHIDVIWFREEYPEYCFEVEHTTDVTKGLLRLYQIRKQRDIRFFVIAPSNIIPKFEKEITKDPFYKIKGRYNFRSYDNLIIFFDSAKTYHRLRESFLE